MGSTMLVPLVICVGHCGARDGGDAAPSGSVEALDDTGGATPTMVEPPGEGTTAGPAGASAAADEGPRVVATGSERGAIDAIRTPHWLQNLASSLLRAPQAGQNTAPTLARRMHGRHAPGARTRDMATNFRTRRWSATMPRMQSRRREVGWIEVICGSMFSGKTEELIRRVRRAAIARLRVQVFKPAIDRRYDDARVISHSAQALDAEPVERAEEIAARVRPDTQVVAIDEAQFFSDALVTVVQQLADRGVRVIVAGLDQDYLGRPFEPIPQLLAIAEEITKCHAICSRCGAPANRSQRLASAGNTARVLIGAAEIYEARCRACFEAPPPANDTKDPVLG